MNMQIEHPLITRLCASGALRDAKVVETCYFCGNDIYDYEEYAIIGALAVCADYDCRQAAFLANADEMLVQFATDWELMSDAMQWYFESYGTMNNEP